MLEHTETMDPYDKQVLRTAWHILANSPFIDSERKRIIENKFQEIVDVYVKEVNR